MIYHALGKTGLQASILGMGLMRLPLAKNNPSFGESINLIRHALQKGIDLFDVGTFYCHSHCETAFGQATADSPNGSFLICGKNSTHQQGSLQWTEQLHNSLRLFGRDHFDLYFLHHLDWKTWQTHFMANGVIDQVMKSRENGLVRFLGFSSHDTPENVKKLISTGYFSAMILPFNILQRDYGEVMSDAHRQGIGVMAMNPLAGGVLKLPFLFNADQPTDKFGSWAGIALNYVLSQPFIDCALSGMESINIIDQNASTAEGPKYTAVELSSIELAVNAEKKKRWVVCTTCGYCLPCVQGIDIPRMISLYNQFSLVDSHQVYAREYYLSDINAESCVQCGSCEERCPREIEIAKIMQEIGEKFRGNSLDK